MPDSVIAVPSYHVTYANADNLAAFNAALSADPELKEDDVFFERVVHDKLVYVPTMDFETGKALMTKCQHYFDDSNDIEAVRQCIVALLDAGNAAKPIVHEIISRFNNASTLYFNRVTPGNKNTRSFLAFGSLDEIDEFLTDTGNECYEPWKEDRISFGRALTMVLRESFGAVFDPNHICIADPDDEHQLMAIASHPTCDIRLKNGVSARFAWIAYTEEERKAQIEELKELVKTKFYFYSRTQTIFHNAHFLDDTLPKKKGLQVIKDEHTLLVLSELLQKFGMFELVNVMSHEFHQPILIGLDFGAKELVGRRIFK